MINRKECRHTDYNIYFVLLGDRARYPFKLRGKPLVTIPIVVAVLRKTKTAVKQYNDP